MRTSFLLFLSLLFVACSAPDADTSRQVATWIDVRTPEEYRSQTVGTSINVPYDEIEFRIQNLDIQKDDPVIVFCRSGRRSGIAAETLQALGYTDVTDLGGFSDAQRAYLAQ